VRANSVGENPMLTAGIEVRGAQLAGNHKNERRLTKREEK
jgi:hypothetical protein